MAGWHTTLFSREGSDEVEGAMVGDIKKKRGVNILYRCNSSDSSDSSEP